MPGVKGESVNTFLQLSRSTKGIDGTADDIPFNSLPDVKSALGFNDQQFQQIAALVGFKDQVFRILSVGKSGDVTRSVRMVVRKGGNIQLISWKELSYRDRGEIHF